MTTSPFDAEASNYDVRFTHSLLGKLYRQAVWAVTDRVFSPGMSVLDIGCGTGEDALRLAARGCHVVGVDESEAMIEVASEKAKDRGETDVTFRQLPAEGISRIEAPARFDGVLSNFGVLNCVADLDAVVSDLNLLTEPGGQVVICMLGRWVPWEWLWFLARGEPRRAFRRLHAGGAQWRGATVRYPSVDTVVGAFAATFKVRSRMGIGVFLPPSYAEGWALRHRRTVESLHRIERTVQCAAPFPSMGDHFLLEMERR